MRLLLSQGVHGFEEHSCMCDWNIDIACGSDTYIIHCNRMNNTIVMLYAKCNWPFCKENCSELLKSVRSNLHWPLASNDMYSLCMAWCVWVRMALCLLIPTNLTIILYYIFNWNWTHKRFCYKLVRTLQPMDMWLVWLDTARTCMQSDAHAHELDTACIWAHMDKPSQVYTYI